MQKSAQAPRCSRRSRRCGRSSARCERGRRTRRRRSWTWPAAAALREREAVRPRVGPAPSAPAPRVFPASSEDLDPSIFKDSRSRGSSRGQLLREEDASAAPGARTTPRRRGWSSLVACARARRTRASSRSGAAARLAVHLVEGGGGGGGGGVTGVGGAISTAPAPSGGDGDDAGKGKDGSAPREPVNGWIHDLLRGMAGMGSNQTSNSMALSGVSGTVCVRESGSASSSGWLTALEENEEGVLFHIPRRDFAPRRSRSVRPLLRHRRRRGVVARAVPGAPYFSQLGLEDLGTGTGSRSRASSRAAERRRTRTADPFANKNRVRRGQDGPLRCLRRRRRALYPDVGEGQGPGKTSSASVCSTGCTATRTRTESGVRSAPSRRRRRRAPSPPPTRASSATRPSSRRRFG